MRSKPAQILALSALTVVAAFAIWFFLMDQPANAPSPNNTDVPNAKPPVADPKAPQANIDDPTSLTVVINKKRPLPDNYVPSDLEGNLRSEAASGSRNMLAAAGRDGVNLKLISGYRSQATQASVYDSYVKQDGRAAADTYSARPRYSEHQTGLAADYGNADGSCDLETCFETTPGGRWIAANAHKYGFIIRYEKGRTNITGYQYEPWHLRYVGTDLAGQIRQSGKTMEEFFGLPAAPTY